jgi:hypothetical protein
VYKSPGGATCHYHRNNARLEPEQRDESRRAQHGRRPFEGACESLRPQHVVRKEDREIEYDPDDRRRDAGQRRGEREIAVRAFDERRAEEDKDEARQEREIGDDQCCDRRAEHQVVRAENFPSSSRRRNPRT